jgi:hypothetical protein
MERKFLCKSIKKIPETVNEWLDSVDHPKSHQAMVYEQTAFHLNSQLVGLAK